MGYEFNDARFETICPVVRTERRRFERACDVSGGLHVLDVVGFEAEIVWVRESATVAAVVDVDGRVLKESAEHNDFYGLLTSVDEPLSKHAAHLMRTYDVRPDGRLSVRVVTRVRDIPCVVDGRNPDGVFRGTRAYRRIPGDWSYAPCAELAAWLEAHRAGGSPFMADVPRVESFEHPDMVVFDSRLGPDVAAQAADLPAKAEPYLVGVPAESLGRVREALHRAVAEAGGAGKAA